MKRRRSVILVSALLLGAAAIGPPQGADAAGCPPQKSGAWAGTFTAQNSYTGTLNATLVFTDGTASGTVGFDNGPATEPVNGTIACNAVTLGTVGDGVTFTGTINAAGTTVTGTYNRTSPFIDSGTWTASVTASKPLVSVHTANVPEGDVGMQQSFFAVTLSEPSTVPVSVQYQVKKTLFPVSPYLAATPGADFTTKLGTLKFNVSTTTGLTPTVLYITVNVLSDLSNDGGQEMYDVVLTGASNATLDHASTFGLINDDDYFVEPLPTLAIGGAAIAEGDVGRRLVKLPISLDEPATVPVTVEWGTGDTGANYSAVAPFDYRPMSGSVTFTAGQTRKFVTVAVVPDLVAEGFPNAAEGPSEFFDVHLLDITGPAVTYNTFARVAIIDQ